MTSTTLIPIGQKIVDQVQGVTLDGSPSIVGRLWAPNSGDVGTVPAVVVYPPAVVRTEPDAREDHIGATDWFLDYPADLYVDAGDMEFGQQQIVEFLEAAIKAIDANPGLDDECQEAKLTRAEEPTKVELNNRKLLMIRCRVRVLEFV